MKNNFEELVRREQTRCKKLYPPITTHHEAYGLLKEEFHELQIEIFKKDLNTEDVLKELVQLGHLCKKYAEDKLLSNIHVEKRK